MIRLLKNIVLLLIGLFAGRRSKPVTKTVVHRAPRPGWKLFFKRLAMLVPVLAVGGFLLAASGVIPIKASSGHWAITAWLLEFSMSRSVATHTIGMSTPPLDDRALVVKGAGHYETGCRPCHGGPADLQPAVARAMTPHPPHLPPEIPKWEPEELFYIVKHGVKFTGMPAWPALEREDEVWAVTAFLLRLPEMTEDGYRDLVFGSEPVVTEDTADVTIADLAASDVLDVGAEESDMIPNVPDVVGESCARCHGARGEGREVSAFPRLAGQQANYLYASLRTYASGERHSGIMEPIAAGMSEDEMRETAVYYAQADPWPRLVETAPVDTSLRHETPRIVGQERLSTGDPAAADTADGRQIALLGIPSRDVPSCVDCHGPTGRDTNPFYPVLAGQYADYLFLQLRLFKERRRGGSAFARIMHESVDRLTEQEMWNVARFYEEIASRSAP